MQTGLGVESADGEDTILASATLNDSKPLGATTCQVTTLKEEALPQIDRELEKAKSVLDPFFATRWNHYDNPNAERFIALEVAKDLWPRMVGELSLRKADQINIVREEFGRTRNILTSQILQTEASLREYEKTRANAIDSLKLLMASFDRVPSQIKPELFEKYDLDTPNGLRDKQADQLITAVLEAYGHKNHGRSLFERRQVNRSSFSQAIIPQEVRELVKFQGLSADSNLDGENARPTLVKLRDTLKYQLDLREKLLEVKEAFALPEPGEIADRVLTLFAVTPDIMKAEMEHPYRHQGRHTEPYNTLPVEVRAVFEAQYNFSIKKVERDTLQSRLERLEAAGAPFMVALDAAYAIAKPRDDIENENLRRIQDAESAAAALRDPVSYINRGQEDRLSSYYVSANDSDRRGAIGILITAIEGIKWYQFWRRGFRKGCQNAICSLIEAELSALGSPLAAESSKDVDINSVLARTVEGARAISAQQKSTIMAALYRLPIKSDMLVHVAVAIFGTANPRGDESESERSARAARRIADTKADFDAVEKGLDELR